ncbi:MAG: VaFE repeat-containing surface-anchored protein [Oscillospiraceae bacterium]|nr:VaFE repeat-containing surface-anchored protein [Oscillospiraceae bacterium]
MISALPAASDITIDNYEDVIAQLDAIDEAKLELYYAGNTEIDYLDYTKYDAACAAIEQIETDIANGVYDEEEEEEEGEDEDDNTYVDPAEPETPETDPDVTEEEEQEEEQEEETVDYDQDAVDAFINAYLTSEDVAYPFDESVSDEDAVVYSEVTEDNYEQILSGTDAWDALSEAEQDAVNAVITAAYIAANPDEFDGMSEEEIASFELTWDELVSAAEVLEEELAECDMEAVNDFINNYLTDSSVTYPFTDEEIAAYAEYLVKVENGEEMDKDYVASIMYYYVYYYPYGHTDSILAGESDWNDLTSAEKKAVNEVIASYAELRGYSTVYTYAEMLTIAYNIQEETDNIASIFSAINSAAGQDNEQEILESVGLEYVGEYADGTEMESDDSGIMTADLSYDTSTDYYSDATISDGNSYKYLDTNFWSIRFNITIDGDTGYGVCIRPSLDSPDWSSADGSLYKYTATDAFVASLVYNKFLNTETYTDEFYAYWNTEDGIIDAIESGTWNSTATDIDTTNGQYAFYTLMHETSAYIATGSTTYSKYGNGLSDYYSQLRAAIKVSGDYIKENYKSADLAGWTVYIYVPDDADTYQYVAFLVYNPPDEEQPLYITKSSSNTTITSGNSNYSLEGTEIGVWTNETDAKNGSTSASSYVGKITLDSSGNGSMDVTANTTYYVRELKAGTGYILDTTVTTVTVTDSPATVTLTNAPQTAKAYVVKTSSGNSNAVSNAASGAYNLAGTVITIYSDSAMTKSVGTLTVSYDSSTGTYKSDTLTLAINTKYYWKETTTGTGYNNSSNLNQTGNFTTGSSGSTYKISVENTPTVRYVRFTKATASTTVNGQSYSTIVSQGGDGNYSFTGAVITIYTDSVCTNVYATATITSSGYSDYIAIPLNTELYYKETTAPTGYKLNSTVYTISAGTGNTTTAGALLCTITEDIIYLNLRIHKTVDSSYSSWNVEDNSCYSLVGTTFGVYTTAANARSDTNRIGTLTVGSNGYTGYLAVARNTTYYIKELSAGTGFETDSTVYSVTTGSGSVSSTVTVTKEISNVPGNDPLTITLTKTGYDGTTQKSLAGAVFSVTYYAGYYTSESAAIAAGVESRTWYLQTVQVGNYYRASFNLTGSLLTSGTYTSDTLYTVDGVIVVPYGTLVIKEVQAAEGYLNDPSFTDSTGNTYGDTYIFQATENGFANVSTGNTLSDAVSVTDTLIPEISTTLTGTTGLSAHKAQASTSTTLTDTIDLTYLNDFVGKTVTITGQLYYTDGTPVTVNGSYIKASQTVTITGTEQTVTQTFTFDASSLVGLEVVCYEEFIYNGETITDHSDPWDENQIVWFEPIGPGSISVTKTDSEGNTLAGATYLLEYSTDGGTTWEPVYSYTTGAKDGYVAGGCSSDDLTDGMLTTGTDGVVTFSDLYADGSILYRLTEVQAPEGYTLLAESVYEGTLYVLADDSIDTTIYDVNGDGDITYADYRYLYNYVNNGGSAPASGTGDINKDGRINASDVTAIKTFLDDWTSGDSPFNRLFDIAYLVKDGSVFDMPLTGGNGTNWVPFVLAGMLGVMAGGVVFVLKRKKKDDELPTA